MLAIQSIKKGRKEKNGKKQGYKVHAHGKEKGLGTTYKYNILFAFHRFGVKFQGFTMTT
jgi:hypothetical protein